MSAISKQAPSINAIITATQINPDILKEGWLLKKKRKKLQGYARRYFVLHGNGILAYSIRQGDHVRDEMPLSNAAFSSSPANRSIHVDSGTATFHLRALTQSDYEQWMSALRKFIATPRPMSAADGTFRRSLNYGHTVNFSIGHATKMHAILDQMGETLQEIHDIANTLNEANQASIRSKREHPKESSREAGLFGLFAKNKLAKAKSTENLHDIPAKAEDESPKTSGDHFPRSLVGVVNGIGSLEKQHKQLVSAFNALLHLDTVLNPTRAMSPTQGDWIGIRYPSRAGTARRTMSTGTMSDESVQWFDADDGPEEYLIEDPEPEMEAEEVVPQALSSGQDSDSDVDEQKQQSFVSLEEKPTPVKRRTRLPAPAVGDEMSLLNVLRKNVGKDLSQISLPVGFNEPISILQRLAEDLEYAELIERTVDTEDPIHRLCLVAAFAVSGYACTRLRASRKPFNPMLGETFEDSRFNFIAEKVCHVPPVMACHASGKGWTYDSVTQAKQKFWGRSLEIIPMGTTTLRVGNDVYSWQKPSSFMRNIVAGTKYLEHVGCMIINNQTDGRRCEITFKEAGMWGNANVVNAIVFSPKGHVETKIDGKWDESLAKVVSRNQLEVLWRANDLPSHAQDYFGFTNFAMTLNEITEDLQITAEDGSTVVGYKFPLTDSRLRPDQRALEEGRIDEADEIKTTVEEKQRARRRAGKEVKPRWFKKTGNEDNEWAYAGGYWEAREEGWGKQAPLW